MDPTYLNDLLPLNSILCSSFIFCMSLPTFKYSVSRIFTLKSHFCPSSIIFFGHNSASYLSCAIIAWSPAKKMMMYCFVSNWQSHPFVLLVPVTQDTFYVNLE